MTVTRDALVRDIQAAIDKLDPKELADYMYEMLLEIGEAEESGKITKDESDAQFDAVTEQIRKAIDNFSANELYRFGDRTFHIIVTEFINRWLPEIVSTYDEIIALYNVALCQLIFSYEFVLPYFDSVPPKEREMWVEYEQELNHRKKFYEAKRDYILKSKEWDLLKELKSKLDQQNTPVLSDTQTLETKHNNT